MSQEIKLINIDGSNKDKLSFIFDSNDTYLYINDILDINHNTHFNFQIKKNGKLFIYLNVINNHNIKQYDLTIENLSNSLNEVNVNVLSNNKGSTLINLKSIAPVNTANIVSHQSIHGVMIDDDSIINVTPSMLIDTNSINASHAVNIGHLDPEQLFYLMSRGLNKKIATTLLLQSMFGNLKLFNNNELESTHSTIISKLNNIIS